MIALGATVQVGSARGTRMVPARELITGPLTTSLDPDELIESIRIPRFGPHARASHHKISVQPGDFAESFAVVVIDPARNEVRAVVSGNGQPPMLLAATSRAISAGSKDVSAIKQTVREDMQAMGLDETLSAYDLTLHQTSMVRAAREIWSS